MKTILVPLDGTPLAEHVLPYAQLLAPALGAKALLLRAATEEEQERFFEHQRQLPIDIALLAAPPVCQLCRLRTQCRHTDCYLATQAERLRACGVEAYGDICVGAPATVIAESAEQWPDTLIAMATRGHRVAALDARQRHRQGYPQHDGAVVRGARSAECTASQAYAQAYPGSTGWLGVCQPGARACVRAGSTHARQAHADMGRRTVDRGVHAQLCEPGRSAACTSR